MVKCGEKDTGQGTAGSLFCFGTAADGMASTENLAEKAVAPAAAAAPGATEVADFRKNLNYPLIKVR
jgi:hypothetical protein